MLADHTTCGCMIRALWAPLSLLPETKGLVEYSDASAACGADARSGMRWTRHDRQRIQRGGVRPVSARESVTQVGLSVDTYAKDDDPKSGHRRW